MKISLIVLALVYAVELIAIIIASLTTLPVRPWPDWAQGTIIAMLFGPVLILSFPFAPWRD